MIISAVSLYGVKSSVLFYPLITLERVWIETNEPLWVHLVPFILSRVKSTLRFLLCSFMGDIIQFIIMYYFTLCSYIYLESISDVIFDSEFNLKWGNYNKH